MQKPTVIDLFCGSGGMSWGLYKAGFNILAGIDSWGKALETFKINHPTACTIEADISNLNPQSVINDLNLKQGELDCIVGGPPCQGFSKNVPAAYRFLEDPRNQLFHEYLRFVDVMKPKVVIMENVAEIYKAYNGAIRTEIVDGLKKLGYEVEVSVLYAPDYGVPQRRRRCFFFASRTGVKPVLPPPTFGPKETSTLFGSVKKYRSAWSAISDLPILQNGEGYEPMNYYHLPQNDFQSEMRKNSDVICDHITRKLREKQFLRISSLKPGQGIKNLPEELRPKSGYSGAYGRLDFEMIAPTITRWFFHPGSGRFCHPREIRLLTIREAARLQSFSDDFRFIGTYIEKSHQVGNAVPPLIMKNMTNNIKVCLQVLPKEAQQHRWIRDVQAQY
ncbi:DNA cytosine methyltransferase [Anaerolineales bacterium HSG24]|nr:DNA cytosine methyltransferase [Anaerolineales bacterium HSG24]